MSYAVLTGRTIQDGPVTSSAGSPPTTAGAGQNTPAAVWSQAFASQHAAMHWEWEIKQWPRAKKIDLIQTQQRLPEEE